MSGFFKKAVSLFVEIEDDKVVPENKDVSNPTITYTPKSQDSKVVINQNELDKFEKHFEALLTENNIPGPDYFEFCKMNEALEVSLADEKTRFSAVYAALTVQGLTKDKLVSSAVAYKAIIDQDKLKFEGAVKEKFKNEVDHRKSELAALEKKIVDNSEAIKRLTKEITDAQTTIQKFNQEIGENQNKIKSSTDGYSFAYNAVMNKINLDIQKIQSLI